MKPLSHNYDYLYYQPKRHHRIQRVPGVFAPSFRGQR